MTPADVRQALAQASVHSDGGDYDLNPHRRAMMKGPLKNAAVLVPILLRPEGLSLLLTQRTETLSSHAGQISFPGGRIDAADSSPTAAALREAYEEVGIPETSVDVIGQLSWYQTGSGYNIQPVVGLVRPNFNVRPQPTEVAEVFEVPLLDALDPESHLIETREWENRPIHFYVIPVAGRRVWGATAGILVNLSRHLGLRS
jgi:8-oxo-dGTP pyrophosphatase MutT (NUDIX family)